MLSNPLLARDVKRRYVLSGREHSDSRQEPCCTPGRSGAASLIRRASEHREPILQAEIDGWHFKNLLSGLLIYTVTSIAVKEGRSIEIAGDYEDGPITLIYSQINPARVCEVRFAASANSTGLIVRRPEQIKAVLVALYPALDRFVAGLAKML